jgi:hypothetical protein
MFTLPGVMISGAMIILLNGWCCWKKRCHTEQTPTYPVLSVLPAPLVFNMNLELISRWRHHEDRSRPFHFLYIMTISFPVHYDHFLSVCQTPQTMGEIYDNDYSLIIDIYFWNVLYS